MKYNDLSRQQSELNMNIGHSTHDPTNMGYKKENNGDTTEYHLDNLNQWWLGHPRIVEERSSSWGIPRNPLKTMPETSNYDPTRSDG
jgi:hypothetical protein